jgi:hypothetical protein
MAASSALIVAGAFLFFIGVMAGASDVVKLALFGMGLGAFFGAGILEIAARRS